MYWTDARTRQEINEMKKRSGSMKKIVLLTGLSSLMLVLSLVFVSCQNKQIKADRNMTLNQIISRCTEAMGGSEIIDNIENLRIGAVFPDHGSQALYFEMKRPNLSYSPQSGIVFDGKRACFMRRTEPELVGEEEWKDFDVEIGFWFPAFLDYSSELEGIEVVDGKEFYALKINLPLGAKMTYLIDVKSFLPVLATAVLKMHGNEVRPRRDFSDYKNVEGILYPHGFTYGSRNGRQNGYVTSVKINIPMSEDKFTIPIEQD